MEYIIGTIYGNAIGDALGLATEFMTEEEVSKKYGKIENFEYSMIIQDYHRKTWKRGDWTDDTDQMLLVLDTLVESKSADQRLFSKKLSNWLDYGFKECEDTKGHGAGNTTSIWWGDKFIFSDPEHASLRVFVYNPFCPCNSESNGAVMRTSIIGLFNYNNTDDVINNTIKICTVTHSSPKAVLSCLFITILITKIIKREIDNIFEEVLIIIKNSFMNYCEKFHDKIENLLNLCQNNYDNMSNVIINNINQYYKKYDYNEIINEFKTYIDVKNLDELKLNEKIGYTFKPVGCACYGLKEAFNEHNNFEKIICKIIQKGGDADTNCAVAGSVLGAYYGINKIPNKFKDNLYYKDFLEKKITKFLNI